MASPILSGLGYYKIASTPTANNFILNPIDDNGNLFDNVTIVIDTTLSPFTLILPQIAPDVDPNTPTVNNSLGFNLSIVKSTTDVNKVTIVALGTDTIGGSTNGVLEEKGCFVLSPVSTEMWGGFATF